MKPENKFRIWFIAKARGYMAQHYPGLRVRFQKHADYVTSGVPDMDIAIAGITLWFEFKQLPSCKKERKLDVSLLQQDYLRELAEAGVGRGLLVGLALGPRQGYDVALYHTTIPTVASRNDFRPWTIVVDTMVEMAKCTVVNAQHEFHKTGSRVGLVGHLPIPDLQSDYGLDDAHEDGG